MTTRQPGLRTRLQLEARRITGQHRRLDSLFGALCEAVGSGAADTIRASFETFRQALEAHFGVEESTEFPALRGLDPTTAAEIERLVGDHGRFRERLAQLETGLSGSDLEHEAAELERFAQALWEHEAREERLFEASTGGPRPGP